MFAGRRESNSTSSRGKRSRPNSARLESGSAWNARAFRGERFSRKEAQKAQRSGHDFALLAHLCGQSALIHSRPIPRERTKGRVTHATVASIQPLYRRGREPRRSNSERLGPSHRPARRSCPTFDRSSLVSSVFIRAKMSFALCRARQSSGCCCTSSLKATYRKFE